MPFPIIWFVMVHDSVILVVFMELMVKQNRKFKGTKIYPHLIVVTSSKVAKERGLKIIVFVLQLI